jgi:uncharacterized membrane protein YfcA
MTSGILAILAVVVFATSFLSGIFGVAGGLILMGALLLFVPVTSAMVLHAVTQMAANGWRSFLWRAYVEKHLFARYMVGAALAFLLFALIRFVPDRALVLVTLGIMPFIVVAVPDRFAPRADRRFGSETCGFLCTALQLISGVSGPALDIFFIRTNLDRRAIVATKGLCQVATHFLKLVYFGSLVGAEGPELAPHVLALSVVLALAGTTLSRKILDRLSDAQFRRWTQLLVMAIGAVYVVQGVHLAVTR